MVEPHTQHAPSAANRLGLSEDWRRPHDGA